MLNSQHITAHTAEEMEAAKHKGNLKLLDGLRGMAALYVLVCHARMLLTQPYYEGYLKHPGEYSLIDRFMVYFLSMFRFGHEAVILFFVLSGFVIHLQQAKRFKTGAVVKQFKLFDYFSKRTIRVYPTLITSMVLCVVLDYISRSIFNDPKNMAAIYNFKTFAMNFILLPNDVAWGSNAPIWSLKHEWFFYTIYPALLWLSIKRFFFPLAAAIILFILYYAGLRIPFVEQASYTLLIWWLGALTAEIYCNRFSFKFNYKFYLPIIGFIIILSPFRNDVTLHDLFIAFFFIALIAILLDTNFAWLKYPFSLFAPTGNFSYSIYMLHYPILIFMLRCVLKTSLSHQVPYHAWYTIAAIAIIIPFVYLIYLVTERQAQKLKAILFSN